MFSLLQNGVGLVLPCHLLTFYFASYLLSYSFLHMTDLYVPCLINSSPQEQQFLHL